MAAEKSTSSPKLRGRTRREPGLTPRCADNISRGMFQRKLDRSHFEKLGIPRKDMTRYLNGEVLPNVDRLLLIAGELGVKSHRSLVEEDLFLEHVTPESTSAPAPIEGWVREALNELRQVEDPVTALNVLRALPKRRSNAAS